MDSGKKFFAWTIVSGDRVIDTAMLSNTVDTFAEDELYGKTMLFSNEVSKILNAHPEITDVVAERFMVRSTMMGANCEFISYMLGYLYALCTARRINLHLVMSSTWKTYMQRTFRYESKVNMTEVFGFTGFSKNFVGLPLMEHQFDSFGIATWYLAKCGAEPWHVRKMLADYASELWEIGKPSDKVHLKSWEKIEHHGLPAEDPEPPVPKTKAKRTRATKARKSEPSEPEPLFPLTR